MAASPRSTPPSRRIEAYRIDTRGEHADGVQESVDVAVEHAVTLDVERVDSYTLLCLPGEHRALAMGFLLSEGIIDGVEDVAELRPCDDDDKTLRVRLTNPVPRIGDEGRNLLIVSSCGLCGAESLDQKLASLSAVGDTLRVERPVLQSVGRQLRDRQPLFCTTGGTHGVGLFDASGAILSAAEDTGRHNALDKAIGKHLLAGGSPAGLGAVLSGRVSLEMVGKCARAGIELISAVSAPTSLALEVSQRCNITLCAFVRETRATIFCHPHRVRGPDGTA